MSDTPSGIRHHNGACYKLFRTWTFQKNYSQHLKTPANLSFRLPKLHREANFGEYRPSIPKLDPSFGRRLVFSSSLHPLVARFVCYQQLVRVLRFATSQCVFGNFRLVTSFSSVTLCEQRWQPLLIFSVLKSGLNSSAFVLVCALCARSSTLLQTEKHKSHN